MLVCVCVCVLICPVPHVPSSGPLNNCPEQAFQDSERMLQGVSKHSTLCKKVSALKACKQSKVEVKGGVLYRGGSSKGEVGGLSHGEGDKGDAEIDDVFAGMSVRERRAQIQALEMLQQYQNAGA